MGGRADDLDGTDIRDEQINEPTGSCDVCGVNIYEENMDTGLCDQCEWDTGPPSKERP